MIEYKVFEDNGGGVHFAVLQDGECVCLCCGLEQEGEWIASWMIAQLSADENAWTDWECPDWWDRDDSAAYDEISDRDALVAWGNAHEHSTIDQSKMGYAARKALGLHRYAL